MDVALSRYTLRPGTWHPHLQWQLCIEIRCWTRQRLKKRLSLLGKGAILKSILDEILWIEEILHHLGCIKPCKWWSNPHINWCRNSSINRTIVTNPNLNDSTKEFESLQYKCNKQYGSFARDVWRLVFFLISYNFALLLTNLMGEVNVLHCFFPVMFLSIVYMQNNCKHI